MATTEQPFEQVLMYLRAAGHDTGEDTRARLQKLIGEHRQVYPDLDTSLLMEKVPEWFDLPARNVSSLIPPIVRSSIGYPHE